MSASQTDGVPLPDQPQQIRPTRAAKACRRCHRKKLRCFGGCPCSSCKRAHQSCDFGDHDSGGIGSGIGEQGDYSYATTGSVDVSVRFNQLEKLVKDLLQKVGNTAKLDQQGEGSEHGGDPSHATVALDTINNSPSIDFPLPSFEIPVETTGSEIAVQPERHVSFPGFPDYLSPPVRPLSQQVRETGKPKSQKSPESRLAASQDAAKYGAPLQSLAFNPAYWDNADRTRPPSPVREPVEQAEDFWTTFDVRPGLKDDPISLGIIDSSTAESLVNFFLLHCHRFMPFLEFSRPLLERMDEVRQMGPYLFTSVLAVGARFKSRVNRHGAASPPLLNRDASLRLRRLAYAHFASSHFRRHQSLRDLQATLLLSGWGLHGGYEGPEAWMSTGHCGRLAHRLGLNTLGKTWSSRSSQDKSPLEVTKLLGQWKTWLCWFCFDTSLELGFGRPPMIQSEPDNEAFLQLVEGLQHDPDAIGSALYLIGLTRLVKIGRELSRWLQSLNEQDSSSTGPKAIQPNLQQLNRKMDAWAQAWIWNGSSYYLRMGSYIRLIKLQSQHLRLCLNSLALRNAFADDLRDTTSAMSSFLTSAAMSALDIIQAYIESVSGDGYFNFCLDYICLTIGHALVFLIRLYLSQQPIPLERSVILHYLQQATDLMESSDLSVIGQASHVARTCRDLCRAGQIPLPALQTETRIAESFPDLNPALPSDLLFDNSLLGDFGSVEALDFGWLLGVPTFGYADGPGVPMGPSNG